MKKEEIDFALKACICKGCPSYVKCKEKLAYCVLGKSKCINVGRGCLCGGCPVEKKLGLDGYLYCIKGKA